MIVQRLLDNIPFFWTFTEEEKERLLGLDCYFQTFQSGDYLIHEEAEDNALFIILKGTAKVTKKSHPDRVITILEPGTVFGEIAFLTQRPRSTDVVANEKMICFTINGETMAQLDSQMQHKIKDQLIEILVQRLDQMNQTLLNLVR
ncbi:MAG: cyclic nucleotide-binding domain-containing protein [Magnetococcales bacterium]|nr:cyclic nucleotide-binding domain-containing protein [Magnetococcales bacterium]NGZ06515.1 cyclic nucleotide-binding domain-containing protein [Magnetococcales bacterium]